MNLEAMIEALKDGRINAYDSKAIIAKLREQEAKITLLTQERDCHESNWQAAEKDLGEANMRLQAAEELFEACDVADYLEDYGLHNTARGLIEARLAYERAAGKGE